MSAQNETEMIEQKIEKLIAHCDKIAKLVNPDQRRGYEFAAEQLRMILGLNWHRPTEPPISLSSYTGPALLYLSQDGTINQLDLMPYTGDGFTTQTDERLTIRDQQILMALWNTFTGARPR